VAVAAGAVGVGVGVVGVARVYMQTHYIYISGIFGRF
jgi:hypothetical protein